jgi:hypothetical protein
VEYSKIICSLCDNDLDVFSNFRLNLIAKQKSLYNYTNLEGRFISEDFDPDPKVFIKREIEDSPYEEDVFIDCTTFMNRNDVKTEENEINLPGSARNVFRRLSEEQSDILTSKRNKFQCEQKDCDYSSSRNTSLMLHMKSVHQFSIDPKHERVKQKRKCNICGAMVKYWRQHATKAHKDIKNFFCDVCGHGTFFKADIESHMKTHVKKEPQKFFCDMCGLEFDKQFKLNNHIKVKHTSREKIHQCTLCEKCKLIKT